MKKLLIVLLSVALLATLCACNYVPSTRFMSSAQVNALTKKYDKPQAELTLNYRTGSTDVEVKVVYDLLLSQTPIATVRFIQLVNDGFYESTFMDNYDSTNKYLTFGRYVYVQSKQNESKNVYLKNPMDVTFKGEFKSNGYRQPKEGYAQFSLLSLAMYHDAWTESNNTFDSANGYLIMAMANQTLNSDNYAVFATVNSITVKYGDKEATSHSNLPSDVNSILTKTSKTSYTVYDDDSETNSTSVSLLSESNRVKVHIEILGDYDWSALPKIGQ